MPISDSAVSRPRHLRSPAPRILRWRFPAGTIALVGGGLRWERTEDDGPSGHTLFTGPLEIVGGIGYLGAADLELPLASAPDKAGYDALPKFQLCHTFYDEDLAGQGRWGFGPWFCLCGHRGRTLGRLLSGCPQARYTAV